MDRAIRNFNMGRAVSPREEGKNMAIHSLKEGAAATEANKSLREVLTHLVEEIIVSRKALFRVDSSIPFSTAAETIEKGLGLTLEIHWTDPPSEPILLERWLFTLTDAYELGLPMGSEVCLLLKALWLKSKGMPAYHLSQATSEFASAPSMSYCLRDATAYSISRQDMLNRTADISGATLSNKRRLDVCVEYIDEEGIYGSKTRMWEYLSFKDIELFQQLLARNEKRQMTSAAATAEVGVTLGSKQGRKDGSSGEREEPPAPIEANTAYRWTDLGQTDGDSFQEEDKGEKGEKGGKGEKRDHEASGAWSLEGFETVAPSVGGDEGPDGVIPIDGDTMTMQPPAHETDVSSIISDLSIEGGLCRVASRNAPCVENDGQEADGHSQCPCHCSCSSCSDSSTRPTSPYKSFLSTSSTVNTEVARLGSTCAATQRRIRDSMARAKMELKRNFEEYTSSMERTLAAFNEELAELTLIRTDEEH